MDLITDELISLCQCVGEQKMCVALSTILKLQDSSNEAIVSTGSGPVQQDQDEPNPEQAGASLSTSTPRSPDPVPEFQRSHRAKMYSRNPKVAELISDWEDPDENEVITTVSSFKDYSQR